MIYMHVTKNDLKEHQEKIKEKLKQNKKGFLVDEEYDCIICRKRLVKNKGWYDRFGPKCFLCQKALDEGVIPEIICLKRNSWLAMWEISQLGFHPMVIKKLIKRRKLKAKIIKDDKGKPYYYVFLKKENKILDKD